jgi:hypothetical protein
VITIVVLMPAGPAINHPDAITDDGVAYIFAIGLDLEAFIVERTERGTSVARVERCGEVCSSVAASGYHVIRLHDMLCPAEPLYRFTMRDLAVERLVAVLDEDHPVPAGGVCKILNPVEGRVGPVDAGRSESQTLRADEGSVATSRPSAGVKRGGL